MKTTFGLTSSEQFSQKYRDDFGFLLDDVIKHLNYIKFK